MTSTYFLINKVESILTEQKTTFISENSLDEGLAELILSESNLKKVDAFPYYADKIYPFRFIHVFLQKLKRFETLEEAMPFIKMTITRLNEMDEPKKMMFAFLKLNAVLTMYRDTTITSEKTPINTSSQTPKDYKNIQKMKSLFAKLYSIASTLPIDRERENINPSYRI